jgi:DNA invertase Pin-like site-specific DNA recombinase
MSHRGGRSGARALPSRRAAAWLRRERVSRSATTTAAIPAAPALQRLLADVRDRRIDIVVVYKVDRLTRSLADFAKLVELFDAHGVSFVSVTQQFNTTTSMGRLTPNVLLSFAQFEREVTSERIRDKIGASKRRGLWVGGMVPLGYVSRDKKLFIEEEEAERVRMIEGRFRGAGRWAAGLCAGGVGEILLSRLGLGRPGDRWQAARSRRSWELFGSASWSRRTCGGITPVLLSRRL